MRVAGMKDPSFTAGYIQSPTGRRDICAAAFRCRHEHLRLRQCELRGIKFFATKLPMRKLLRRHPPNRMSKCSGMELGELT